MDIDARIYDARLNAEVPAVVNVDDPMAFLTRPMNIYSQGLWIIEFSF
jgi:hypothetical protein